MSQTTLQSPLDRKLWIDNQERQALSGESFETPNPATGERLATLARAKREDIDAAVASAKKGQQAWAKVSPQDKARLLWKAGELILARTEELARLETLD